MEKTYEKWRPWFDAKFKEAHAVNNVSWNSINRFCRMTGSVLDGRKFTEDELELMSYKLIDPLTGLTAAGPKMQEWHDILDTIRNVCVRQDDVLKRCPDDPEKHGMHRLLYLHQDSLLLLLTTLILHETVYKVVVNFIYDCSGNRCYKRTQTVERAEYLAKHGFDVRPAADYFLRNGIAHSSFRIIERDGNVLVADIKEEPPLMRYDPKSTSLPKGTKFYTRAELISRFEKMQSFMAEAMAGVVYWFHVNHGMNKLFDDRFFGSPEKDAVRESAWNEMTRSNMCDWKSILTKFEKVLPL